MTRSEFETEALELREVAQLDRSSHCEAIDQLERRIALVLISDRGVADGQDLAAAKSSDS